MDLSATPSGSNDLPLIPVIVGPTAVGKTAAALLVTEAVGGEVVSADSRQLYRGMAVGSGAPSADELVRVPHHLVGTIEPHVRMSAGEYARLGRQVIERIIRRGKVPLVVGGSGLYIRALIDGLAPIPPPDPHVRIEIESRIDRRGMDAMLDELRLIDPEYAENVGPGDRKRLARALEVWETTGRSFSSWHESQPDRDWCRPLFFGLTRPRLELHAMIAARVDSMLRNGWTDEVKILTSRYGGFDRLPPSIVEAVGYRDVVAFLKGATDFDSARDRIVVSTRRFARRQLTWFRADERVVWLQGSGSGAPRSWSQRILEHLERIGIRGGMVMDNPV